MGDLRNVLKGLNRLPIPNEFSVSFTIIDQIDKGSVLVDEVIIEKTSEIEPHCHYGKHLACL